MGSGDEPADCEVAIGIEPGAVALNPVHDDEPAYGWVVCMSMHAINGFTWGIIAVVSTRRPSRMVPFV